MTKLANESANRSHGRRTQTSRRIARTFGPELLLHRKKLLMAYSCGLLAVSANALLPWPLKLIIDHVLGDQPLPSLLNTAALHLSATAQIVTLALGAAVIAIAGATFSSFEKNLNARVRERMVLQLRDRLLGHVQTLSLVLDTKQRSGEIMLRLVDDANQVVRLLTKTVPNVLRQVTTTLVLLAIMFYLEPLLGLTGVIVVGVIAILARRYANVLREATRTKRRREGDVSGLAAEIVRGLPSSQALSTENWIRRRFFSVNQQSLAAGVHETRVAVRMERSMEYAKALAIALVVGAGGVLVLGNELTLGSLTVCVAYISQLLRPVSKMNELASSVARALTRGEQLLALLDRKASVQDSINAVPVKQTKGLLAMQKVSFSYPAASDQPSRQKVLREIDLELNPGTLTVLVGPSGEGKSTLLNLMLRLFEPDSGQFLLDGVHYQDLQLRSLRSQFAVMLQTTHLYAGTLREALQPVESSTSDTKLWETLEQVAMNDFAHALPAKLDAPLGEDGINLSGGQRARLSLARALLLDRPILLLDEPLANVDLHSQTVILSALEKIRRGKTCLAVTHQPIMTERADVVVQLKNQALTTLSHRPAQMLDARRAR